MTPAAVARRSPLDPWRKRFLVAWALAIGFGVASFQVANLSYRRLQRPHPLEELSYFPSGRYLRLATLGHAETAADLAWMRAVQYYGEHRETDMLFTRMRHVFDVLTSLAPQFVPAYVFGGFALAQEGRDVAGGERLMLRGVEANPTSGQMAFETGFFYYVRPGGRDLARAAQFFEQAARQKDPPPMAARMAAYAHQNAGNLLAAYELWRGVYGNTKNHYLKEMADKQMRAIRRALRQGRAELAMKRLGVPTVTLRRAPGMVPEHPGGVPPAPR